MGKREFKVLGRGMGKPDFYQKAAPTQPTAGEDQRQWNGLWAGTIDALSQGIVPIYIGIDDWRLNFAGGWLFCDSTAIQTATIEIERPPLPFLPVMIFGYQIWAHAGWHPPALVLVGENQNMRFLVNNLDTSPHLFTLTCLGMEERV